MHWPCSGVATRVFLVADAEQLGALLGRELVADVEDRLEPVLVERGLEHADGVGLRHHRFSVGDGLRQQLAHLQARRVELCDQRGVALARCRDDRLHRRERLAGEPDALGVARDQTADRAVRIRTARARRRGQQARDQRQRRQPGAQQRGVTHQGLLAQTSSKNRPSIAANSGGSSSCCARCTRVGSP